MKGRKLILEDVLSLEDGVKVWVEDTILDDGQIGIIEENEIIVDDGYGWFDLNDFCEEGYIIVYEWIEDELKIPDQIESPYYSHSVVVAMANEIANLRYPNKYEYDGELIDSINSIIKEFS